MITTDHGRVTINITEPFNNRLLLTFLKKELEFSQAKISSVKFDSEGILLNGQPVPVRTFLHTGDVLSIRIMDSVNRQEHLIPAEMPLKILYEDENLIAVNKPAGVVCHPSKGHLTDSLASGLMYYFSQNQPEARVHLLGRLDKETSGIVLCAKNGFTADRLRGKIEKTYTAVAEGQFTEPEGIIRFPMKEVRDQEGILKMTSGPDGKEAVTIYKALTHTEKYTVLEVRPVTGRTHQIRFHMAYFRHPLVGDRMYGTGAECIGRTALHAGELAFHHPFTGERICIRAEVPEDIKRLYGGCS